MVEISLWEKHMGIWYIKADEEVIGTIHPDVRDKDLLYININPTINVSKYKIDNISYNNQHLFICLKKEVKEKDE